MFVAFDSIFVVDKEINIVQKAVLQVSFVGMTKGIFHTDIRPFN